MHISSRCFCQYLERNWRRTRRWWKSGHGAPFQVFFNKHPPPTQCQETHSSFKDFPKTDTNHLTGRLSTRQTGQTLCGVSWPVWWSSPWTLHHIMLYISSCYILSIIFYKITLYCSKLSYIILYQIVLCCIGFMLYYYIIILHHIKIYVLYHK